MLSTAGDVVGRGWVGRLHYISATGVQCYAAFPPQDLLGRRSCHLRTGAIYKDRENPLSNSLPQQLIFPAALVQLLASAESRRESERRAAYEANCHRVFSFAFWMTDSEPMAEHLSERTFLRVFSICDQPDEEMIDRALVRELQSEAAIFIGPLCLQCQPVQEVCSICCNTRREQLERAIVQLPHTERMIFCMHDGDGYDHARIARTLGITEKESRQGLHQARLRVRELVAANRKQAAA